MKLSRCEEVWGHDVSYIAAADRHRPVVEMLRESDLVCNALDTTDVAFGRLSHARRGAAVRRAGHAARAFPPSDRFFRNSSPRFELRPRGGPPPSGEADAPPCATTALRYR